MKRIFSWVLALVMIISLLPAVTVLPVQAAEAEAVSIVLWGTTVTINSETPALYWINNGTGLPTSEGADADNYNYAFHYVVEGEGEEAILVPTLSLRNAVFGSKDTSATGWFLKTKANSVAYKGRLDIVYEGTNTFVHSTSETAGFAYVEMQAKSTANGIPAGILNLKAKEGAETAELNVSGGYYKSTAGLLYIDAKYGEFNMIGGKINMSKTTGSNSSYASLIVCKNKHDMTVENCEFTGTVTKAAGVYPAVYVCQDYDMTIVDSKFTITANNIVGLSLSSASGSGLSYPGNLIIKGNSEVKIDLSSCTKDSSYGAAINTKTISLVSTESGSPTLEAIDSKHAKALANKGAAVTPTLDDYCDGDYKLFTVKDGEPGEYTTTGYLKIMPNVSAEDCTHSDKTTTPGTAATCTTTGTTDKIVCNICGTTLQDHTETPKLSENDKHTPGAEATCDKGQYCTVCNEKMADPIGHNLKQICKENKRTDDKWAYAVLPTCTEPGLRAYKICQREGCGQVFGISTSNTTTKTGYSSLEAYDAKNDRYADPFGHSFETGWCKYCEAEDDSANYVAVDANGKKYKSLAAAIYYANGVEITLQNNVTYGALTIAKDTKINLNGKKITIKQTEGAASAITVNAGVKLEIKGGELRVVKGNAYTAMIENNGTLVVTDVVIRGYELGGENAAILLNKGAATIEGASVVAQESNTDYAIVNKGICEINIAKTDDVDARIKGVLVQEEGELTLTAIRLLGKLSYTEGTVTKAEGVTVSAPRGYVWNNNLLEVKNPVAEVNGVKYASLDEAIAKANGEEIKLLKKVTSDALVITKDTKINIGSYMLFIKQTEGKTVAITVESGATLTLIGGDLRVTGENTYAALIENNGQFVAENVVIRGTEMDNSEAVVLINKGEAEIKGASCLIAVARNNCAIVNDGFCVIDIAAANGIDARIYGAIDNNNELDAKAEYKHFGNKI